MTNTDEAYRRYCESHGPCNRVVFDLAFQMGRESVLGDDQTITEDWLRSIGFDDCRPSHVHGTPNTNWWSEEHGIEIWEFGNTGEWLWIECDSVPMRKRRDLLALINWVGLRKHN